MRGSPLASGAIVSSRNVNVQSVRAGSFAGVSGNLLDLATGCVEAEPALNRRCRQAPRNRFVKGSARPAFGQRMPHVARLAGGRHHNQPFLRPIGDVAFERRSRTRHRGFGR